MKCFDYLFFRQMPTELGGGGPLASQSFAESRLGSLTSAESTLGLLVVAPQSFLPSVGPVPIITLKEN